MLPAFCCHQVRLLGCEGERLPNKQNETLLGSVKDTAFMVRNSATVTPLHPSQLRWPLPAFSLSLRDCLVCMAATGWVGICML